VTVAGPKDHPQRFALVNELHARPFPEVVAPSRAFVLAIRPEEPDAGRERAHLLALLDRFGAPHPPPGANHLSGALGRHRLKWERHTEFASWTVFVENGGTEPPRADLRDLLPADWLAAAPGPAVAALEIAVELADDATPGDLVERLSAGFVPESLVASRVLGGEALVVGDFRIDAAGRMRFAVAVRPGTDPRRLGRLVQRLVEIETYRAMAMLTLPLAREVSGSVSALSRELTALVNDFRDAATGPGNAPPLDRLLALSAGIEALAADSAFRFGAAEAYEAIVLQRIAALREVRIEGRRTLAEFMARRFDPAMRTCRSAKSRLDELSGRAARAANLLRTQVEVAIAAQNRALLESMDRRAGLQLRLQETVEGLSVVAVSYYAVGLAAYAFAPLAEATGLGKSVLLALATPVAVVAVALLLRRVRRRFEGRGGA
jgi:uncharacterized membrane-anchored protein